MNIFERVAETLEAEMREAFHDNNPCLSFFQLGHSTERKEIGSDFPQTDYIDLNAAHSLSYHQLSDSLVRFEDITLKRKSKLTDCISAAAFSGHAYLLSKNALDVFNGFDLGKHRIYPATVLHESQRKPYGVLHFVSDEDDKLSFSESKFYIANLLGGYEYDIDIANETDFSEKSDSVWRGEYPETEEWWSLSLKLGRFKRDVKLPDLFRMSCSQTNDFISKRLAEAILENELTGFKIQRVYNIDG